MRNDKTLSLTDSLMNFLRGTELEQSVLKVQVEEEELILFRLQTDQML